MTQQKSRKRRVRARMAKTGESYTAARRHLIERPAAAASPGQFRGERTASDEVLVTRTGRPRAEWFALLEAWGAAARPHPDIARWLHAEHGVDGWWAQELTVAYEMAIGRRRPGQRPDGFSVTASKTVGVPIERLFDAFVDDALRATWLPGVELRLRTATAHRTARFDWVEGGARLAIGFTPKGDVRSAVALEASMLTDADAAEAAKAFWRLRLETLKQVMEA